MKQKKISGILLLCICMLGIVAVYSWKSSTTVDVLSEENTGQTAITWWAFPVFSQEAQENSVGTYEKKLIAAFEKENPEIKVTLKMIDFTTGPDKIKTAIANGTVCDVLFDAPGRIISYGKEGNLIPLDDLFTEEYEKDVNNDVLLNACKSGGTAYMYPLSSSPFYMAFNKEMLEDAGVLDLVKEGWTTEDFTTVVKALREKGYVSGSVFYADTGGDQATRAFASNLYDGAIIDKSENTYMVDQKKTVKGLEYIKEAVKKGTLVNGSFENGSQDIARFANGQSAFTLLWSASQQNSYQALLDENEIETVEVPYPSEDGAASLEYLVNGFCIFNKENEKRAEASKKFITFLCDDKIWGRKNVKQTGCIPVRHSFDGLYSSERMKKIAEWTKLYGTYYNTVNGFAVMRAEWIQMLKNILNGDKTVTQAAKDFTKYANASLNE